jgi:hypothetical protein
MIKTNQKTNTEGNLSIQYQLVNTSLQFLKGHTLYMKELSATGGDRVFENRQDIVTL